MRKTKENTEISKLRILLAAEEEFCQRGYVAANMDAIANTAGLTKGAIFWHYKSKAGLFNATIQRAIDRINKINKEAFSSSLPIMEKCRKMIKQIKKDKSFSILLSLRNAESTGDIPKSVMTELNKSVREISTDISRRFEEAKECGELRADADIRNIFLTINIVMCGFATSMDLDIMSQLGGNAVINDDSIIDIIFNGLLSFQIKR